MSDTSKSFYYIAVLCLLFLGDNVLEGLGFRNEKSIIGLLQPALFVLGCSLVFAIGGGSNRLFYNKKYCLGGFVVYLAYLIGAFLNDYSGFFLFPTNCILLPFLVLLLLDEDDRLFKKKIYHIVLLFFIIESLWCIFERLYVTNIFPPIYDAGWQAERGVEGFRASALQGSPLTNALCLTAIYIFILISDIPYKRKIWFSVLGYAAILCLNTRTSMILWPILLGINTLYESKIRRIKVNLILLIVLGFVATYAVFYLIMSLNIGDRLFGGDALMDESADVRLQTWDMFIKQDFLSIFFSFGFNNDELQSILLMNNITIIENSWVLYFFTLGGIMFILLVISYYHVFKHVFINYTRYQLFFSISSFLLLGSTNNGLKGIPLSIFLIAALTFPLYRSKTFSKKIK